MDPTIPTPTASSTVTSSSITHQPQPYQHVLEINLISAQDLAHVTKSMRTYAVAWIHPSRKLSTRVDPKGDTNPTWNARLAFRLDDEILYSENSAVSIQIYTVSWFRDILVGNVRVLLSNLVNPTLPAQKISSHQPRFVALQVRRPSGSPQGILNLGLLLVDSTMRTMPLYSDLNSSAVGYRDSKHRKSSKKTIEERNRISQDDQQHFRKQLNEKIQLWRSLSTGSEVIHDEYPLKGGGSICNGSVINNGSIVNEYECSDVGPSASVVAAEIAAEGAKKLRPPAAPKTKPAESDEAESLILEELTTEEAAAKGLTTNVERWRSGISSVDNDGGEKKHLIKSTASRRHSDGGGGLFSCIAYGFEFTIVCGASKNDGRARSKKLGNEARSH